MDGLNKPHPYYWSRLTPMLRGVGEEYDVIVRWDKGSVVLCKRYSIANDVLLLWAHIKLENDTLEIKISIRIETKLLLLGGFAWLIFILSTSNMPWPIEVFLLFLFALMIFFRLKKAKREFAQFVVNFLNVI